MNSKMIFALIGSFLGGAAAGIAGTYVYMKGAYCDKKIEEGIEDYILNRYNPDGSVKEDAADKDEDDFDPAAHEPSVPKYQTPVNSRVPYDDFFEKKSPQDILAEREHPMDSDEENGDFDGMEDLSKEERESYLEGLSASAEHEAYVRGDLDPVEVISEDEFGANPDYDDDVLIYWLGDDVLTSELEEPVFDQLKDSIWDVFTDDWIKKASGDVNADEATLYIRHHEFRKDYKILPEDRAYWECH